MARKQEARTLYTVSCACGASVSLDARSFGRPQVCKKCRGSFTVGWGTDPRTKKTAPVSVSLARKSSPTPLLLLCVCGYRRRVTPQEAAGRNRCPGCGKDMIVEKPAAAGKVRDSSRRIKLSSAPSAPSRPPPPQDPVHVVHLAAGSPAFTCNCGERILVRSQTFGTVIQCHACDRKVQVEVQAPLRSGPGPLSTIPPGSRTPTPLPPGGRTPTPYSPNRNANPIPYSPNRNANLTPSPYAPVSRTPTPPGSRTPTPLPPGSRTPTPPPSLTCECGNVLEILKAFDANGTVCPSCGRTITMESVRAPQSKHTVIRPRFTPKTAQPPPASRPAPPPEPGPIIEMPAAEFVEEDEETYDPIRSSSQEVFCPCGEALSVSPDEAGRNIQCPTCFTLMAVESIRDGNTNNYVLRVRAIGKMDQDTWSLSDFS